MIPVYTDVKLCHFVMLYTCMYVLCKSDRLLVKGLCLGILVEGRTSVVDDLDNRTAVTSSTTLGSPRLRTSWSRQRLSGRCLPNTAGVT